MPQLVRWETFHTWCQGAKLRFGPLFFPYASYALPHSQNLSSETIRWGCMRLVEGRDILSYRVIWRRDEASFMFSLHSPKPCTHYQATFYHPPSQRCFPKKSVHLQISRDGTVRTATIVHSAHQLLSILAQAARTHDAQRKKKNAPIFCATFVIFLPTRPAFPCQCNSIGSTTSHDTVRC